MPRTLHKTGQTDTSQPARSWLLSETSKTILVPNALWVLFWSATGMLAAYNVVFPFVNHWLIGDCSDDD